MEQYVHGTNDEWELYALGRLPKSDVPRLEEHLTICVSCRDKLEANMDFALALREVHGMESEPAPTAALGADWCRWLRWPAFSMAPGFVVMVVAMGIAVVGIFSNGRTTFAPRVSLQLTATRGEMPFTTPAGEFDLTLADGPREGELFRVQVVNVTGAAMWSGLAERSPAGIEVKVMKPLAAGDFFVRLYSASGTMLREYGFRIRT